MRTFAWSYSRLKNYETCPKRHYHYDIKKDVQEPDTPQLSEGGAVHKALELRVRLGTKLPLGMGHFEPLMKKLVSAPGEIYAEQKLALTRDFKPVGFFGVGVWFRTILDYCAINGPKATIIDYKTGKISPDPTQLKLLAATVMHQEPQVEQVKSGLLFLNNNHMERADFDRGDLTKIWAEIMPRVNRLQQALAEQEFPPKPGGLCRRYCAVSSCPYHGVGSQ